MRVPRSWSAGVAFLVVLFFAVLSYGQSARWTNTAAGGNWSVAGNWSPNAVPGSGTNVFLTNNAAISYFTTNDITDETIASLTMSNGTSAAWLVNNASGFNVTGNVALNRNAGFDLNGFSATFGGDFTLTNASAAVIRGATLTNLGFVGVLNSTSVLVVTNNGVLQVGATGLGTMRTAGATTLNSGGAIVASVVTNTGILTTAIGTGLIDGFLRNNGTLIVSNATTTLTLTGGGINAGVINLRSSGVLNIGGANQAAANASGVTFTNLSGATMSFNTTATFNGSTNVIGLVNQGTISTPGATANGTINATILNDVGGLIQPSTTVSTMTFDSIVTNRGTISVNNVSTIMVVNNRDLVNEGLVKHRVGGHLTLVNGSFINAASGEFSIGGASGGTMSSLSTMNYGKMALTNDDGSTQNFALGGAITNAGLFTVLRTDPDGDSTPIYSNSGGFVNSGGVFRAVSSFATLSNAQTLALVPGTIVNEHGGTILATNGAIFGMNGLNNSTNGEIIVYANSVVGNGASSAGVPAAAANRRITVGSLSILNEGAITLEGGVFGAVVVTNADIGTISGNGDIGSTQFTNMPSGGVTNFSRIVRVRDIVNSGTIAPNGVLNVGNITNLSGGSIIGFGTIQSLNTTNRDDGSTTFGNAGARIQNNLGASIFASGGTLVLSNGFFDNINSGTLGATNGTLQLGDGTLALTNNGTLAVYNGGLNIGDLRNNGTVQIIDSVVTWSNGVVTAGRYISDPSTNTFLDDVTVTSSGTLEGGAGDLFDFKQSLTINSTNTTVFDLIGSSVSFTGGADHTNTITGLDLGTVYAGLTSTNFAYGRLALGSSDDVYFRDGDGIIGNTNALYVGVLDLGGLVANISLLHSTNLNIYYDGQNAENAYLNGQTYALDGGGSLIPLGVIPEPSSLLLLLVGSALLFRKRL